MYRPTIAPMLRYNDIRVINLPVSAFFGHLQGGIEAREINEQASYNIDVQIIQLKCRILKCHFFHV